MDNLDTNGGVSPGLKLLIGLGYVAGAAVLALAAVATALYVVVHSI